MPINVTREDSTDFSSFVLFYIGFPIYKDNVDIYKTAHL